MSWDAIGALAELIGAVGVVASLVYLASQIRQNTSAMRGTAHESSVARAGSWLVGIGSNAQVADLMARGHRDYEALATSERLQYGHIMSALLVGFEATLHQYKRGNLEEAIWQRSVAALSTFTSFSGFRTWWKGVRSSFTSDLQRIVDAAIEPAGSHSDPPAA